MDSKTAANIARHGWPDLIGSVVLAEPIVANQLNENPLWRIESDQARYALRGWPQKELPRAEAATRFVTHVARSGELNVPVPLLTQRGAATTLHPAGDRFWELAPWLQGEADFATRPTLQRLEAMCRALARLHLHAADLPAGDEFLAVERHLAALVSLGKSIYEGEYDGLESATMPVECPVGKTWLPVLLRGIDLATRQLTALQAVRFPRQWTWGDAWHNNFLLDGTQVTGLVDFATVRVDTPAADLARLLGSTTVEQPTWWPAGLEAYSEERSLSEAELRAARALEASGTVLSLANWLRWLGIECRPFASPEAVCDRMTHFALRLTHLLSAANSP